MDKDKINLLNRIVKKQDELIDSFTDWVKAVKVEDLDKVAEIVVLSNKLRLEITELKKQLEKLNKRSGIILLKN